MANFGPLTAEIGWRVWGTPANFNGFRVLPSLLQRRPSPEDHQTLHDLWPSAGLVDYVYIIFNIYFRGLLPLTEFCHVQNSLCVQLVLRSPILAELLHGTAAAGSAKLCGVVQGMELWQIFIFQYPSTFTYINAFTYILFILRRTSGRCMRASWRGDATSGTRRKRYVPLYRHFRTVSK